MKVIDVALSMMNICISYLKTLYHKLWWQWQLCKSAPVRKRMRREILEDLAVISRTPEEEEVYSFLQKEPLCVFPYPFFNLYNPSDVKVNMDMDNGLKYVWHKRKRLYFQRGWGDDQIKRAYAMLCCEQHKCSPHCYTDACFSVSPGSVIADIGSAEGVFSLDHIDICRHVYLFETDAGWIEALHATFAPWKDKVTVVNRFVSDKNDCDNVSLDFYFAEREVNFVKADVEGAERFLLRGSQNIMKRPELNRIAITAYHCPDDSRVLWSYLEDAGFLPRYTHGFMVFGGFGEPERPYLRRGVILAEK